MTNCLNDGMHGRKNMENTPRAPRGRKMLRDASVFSSEHEGRGTVKGCDGWLGFKGLGITGKGMGWGANINGGAIGMSKKETIKMLAYSTFLMSLN